MLCVSLIILSAILGINNDGGVYMKFNKNIVIPNFCIIQQLTHFDCPSCGLTRSLISFSKFNFIEGVKYNPLGLIIYIILLFQIPYRIFLLLNTKNTFILRKRFNKEYWALVFSLILLINWMLKIII
jgi:hypothetical protein